MLLLYVFSDCRLAAQHSFFNFIYLSERKGEITSRGKWQAEGEADSSLSREPDAGLHPRTLGP